MDKNRTPIRSTSRDSPKRVKKVNVNYGQLDFQNCPINTSKLTLKTFFGNPETQIFTIRFDPDDQNIAAGCSDGGIKIFSIATGKLIYNLSGSSSGGSTPTTCIRWRPEMQGSHKLKGVLVSGNSDGTLIYWQASSGKQLHRMIEQNNQVLCMDFSPDGQLLATAGQDFCIRIYDDEKKEVIVKYEPAELNQLGHANRIFSIKFIPDMPTTFISGGWDGNVLIWDLRERKAVASINGPSLTGDSLDYKKGQILTGSYRTKDQLQLWDFKQRTLIKEIEWQPGQKQDNFYIYTAQFSKVNPDTIMAGSSGLCELKVFDCQRDHLPTCHIQKIQNGIYTLDHGNTTNKVAFGGGEGVVYICSLTSIKQ